MYRNSDAKRIINSANHLAARRLFFTNTDIESNKNAFDFTGFYQFGTAILIKSNGSLYFITASHVIRNATNNRYINDSPFWISSTDNPLGPQDITSFCMPMRYFDAAPEGHSDLDFSVAELNSMAAKVETFLDWDNVSLFVEKDDEIEGCTAITTGFPREVNTYHYSGEDSTPLPIIRREIFRGYIKRLDNEYIFSNLSQTEDYDYAGLSGGLVTVIFNGKIKHLGISTSTGSGDFFKIVPFFKIREKIIHLSKLPWEVIDESYFMTRPQYKSMNHDDFTNLLKINGKKFAPYQRTNEFLEQVLRSQKSPKPPHFKMDLSMLKIECNYAVEMDLLSVLRLLINQKKVNC